jgi:hypothetical protein
MKQTRSKWTSLFSAEVAIAIFATLLARSELLEKSKKVAGTTVRYKVVLPNGYDPAQTHPAILGLGGGPQTINTLDNLLERKLPARSGATSWRLQRRRTMSCSSRAGLVSSRSF